MKKILLASVGVFAFTAFGAQAAEPVKLSIGGYMFQQFGYASNDLDGYGKVDQQGYSDVTFSGESKFDNGLTAGVNVTMRASQAPSSYSGGTNKNVKYAYAYVDSRFGQVSLGQQQNVGALIHHSAPAFGLASQDGDWMDWVDSAGNGAVQTTYVNDDKAADKINLFTPKWNGLQAGFSYIPDTNVANTGSLSMVPQYQTHPNGGFSSGDAYAFGGTYDTTFSNGVGVGFDVAYVFGNGATSTSIYGGKGAEIGFSAIQTGLNVKYAGFTVGGSFLHRSADQSSQKALVQAGNSWDVGVAYEANPWGVSLSYFGSKNRTTGLYDYAGGPDKDDQAHAIALAGKYNIGPGVELNGTVARVDYKTDSDVAGRENKGWAVVSGVKVNF